MEKITIELCPSEAKNLVQLLKQQEGNILFNACRKYIDNSANVSGFKKNKEDLIGEISKSITVSLLIEQITNKLEK